MTDLHGFYPTLVRQGIFRGINLAALAQRFWQLDAMRASGSVPDIRWRAFGSGSAWATAYVVSQRITMRLGESATVEEAAEVLLHELVHCACPRGEHHGELFRRRLIACAREAFGLGLDTAALLALPPHRKCRAYAIDEAIRKAMIEVQVGQRLSADPDVRFEPPPVETEEDIARRRAEAAEARVLAKRKHVVAMLQAWEKRAERAKRTAAKWRKRARYYEKREAQAAKRRSS